MFKSSKGLFAFRFAGPSVKKADVSAYRSVPSVKGAALPNLESVVGGVGPAEQLAIDISWGTTHGTATYDQKTGQTDHNGSDGGIGIDF